MTDESYVLKPPALISEELVGYKLIGPDSFKDQKNRHQHFMTPNPVIPFFKINDVW
jgi:hypothetical protein